MSERGFWWLSEDNKSNKQLQGEFDKQSLWCNKVVQVRNQPAWDDNLASTLSNPNLSRSLKEQQLYQDSFNLWILCW